MRRKNNKRKKGKQFALDTMIGANTVFQGVIRSDCSVCVEGSVQGKIEAKGEVVVGRRGRVEADIYAEAVVVGGHIVGNINARSRLEITSTGRVSGDIEASTITVAEGGMVDGLFRMTEKVEPAYLQLEGGLSAQETEEPEHQSQPDVIEPLSQA